MVAVGGAGIYCGGAASLLGHACKGQGQYLAPLAAELALLRTRGGADDLNAIVFSVGGVRGILVPTLPPPNRTPPPGPHDICLLQCS